MEDLEVMMMVNANRHGRDLEALAEKLAAISAKRKKGGSIVQKMPLLRRKS